MMPHLPNHDSQTVDPETFARIMLAMQERSMDGLRMIRMTDTQRAVLTDPCSEVLLVGSNRAMKSVTAAVRFASIARDVPVTCMDGTVVHCRRDDQRGHPLRMWVIGDYAKHLGQTIHRLLFEPRVFEMVKDPETNAWRAWNPVQFPEDWNIKPSDRQWAPPLIPECEMDERGIVYENAGKREWTYVKLKNGTEIFAYASSGEVKQGEAVDEIWVDEQLVFDRYYSEYAARLQDRDGRLFWSTIHRDESTAFQLLEERCEVQQREVETGQRTQDEVTSRLHRLTIADNPFIPQEAKDKFAGRTMGERDFLVRVLGMGSRSSILVYPDFDARIHTVEYDAEGMNDEVTRILRDNNWVPPADWTREWTLDPGTQKPALLFGAVPPPSLWSRGEPWLIVYDEIYIRRLDAYQLAERVEAQERGYAVNRFIIDGQAARQRPMGFSWTIGQQYTMAFEKHNLSSTLTGSNFIPGDPSFEQRSNLVRAAMRIRPCGYPQLRIITHKCPELVNQLKRNIRKTDRDGNPLEAAEDRQFDDLRCCLEYWVSRHPTYVEPPTVARTRNDPGYEAWLEKKKIYEQRKKHTPTPQGVPCGRT